uniref:Uncharacterized protein n=1 Tax=Rhizophora mucronata TaxID=61149 RepID=A0A2P2PR23_RHIMU
MSLFRWNELSLVRANLIATNSADFSTEQHPARCFANFFETIHASTPFPVKYKVKITATVMKST